MIRAGHSKDSHIANRNYPNSRIYSNHIMPVSLDASISVGASGVPTIESALGIASITRMAAGQYRIRLQDNYNKLLNLNVTMQSPLSGTPVAATALVAGTVYQIVSLGTTTQAQWVTAGVPSGITAAAGVTFKAAATSSGTGSSQALISSGVDSAELMGNSINMLNFQPYNSNLGGYVDFQTMGPTASGNTAPIATDPASGSKMYIDLRVSNSKVQ